MYDDLPFWLYAVITVVLTQVSTLSVTVYLHRYLTHGKKENFKLHPAVVETFRFTVWLMTGTFPDEWRAIHLWHHDEVETKNDPHSPRHKGLGHVLFGMYFLYTVAKKERARIFLKYGTATPNDWMERNLYRRFTWLGLVLMLPADLLLFGPMAGSIIWAIQILWMPAVAGIINGACHFQRWWWSYRNYQTKDDSVNVFWAGWIIGGEGYHNNHHGESGCAKLSRRWFEIDPGWGLIRVLEICGLASGAKRPIAARSSSP